MLSAFRFEDGAVFHEPTATLVLGDLHLGRTYQIESRSYPVLEHDWLEPRLEHLIEAHEPDGIILNGDTFDALPPSDEAVALVERLLEHVQSVTVTAGNHDDNPAVLSARLQPDVTVTEEAVLDDDIIVFHGHRTPTTPADLFIVNHIHPRHKGDRSTLYHEQGAYNTGVLVLPTFSSLSTGPEYQQYSQTSHAPVIAAGQPLPTYSVVATTSDTPKR